MEVSWQITGIKRDDYAGAVVIPACDEEQWIFRTLDSLGIGARGANAVLGLDGLATLDTGIAGDDLGSRDVPAREQARDHGFGHRAGADDRDGRFLQW